MVEQVKVCENCRTSWLPDICPECNSKLFLKTVRLSDIFICTDCRIGYFNFNFSSCPSCGGTDGNIHRLTVSQLESNRRVSESVISFLEAKVKSLEGKNPERPISRDGFYKMSKAFKKRKGE